MLANTKNRSDIAADKIVSRVKNDENVSASGAASTGSQGGGVTRLVWVAPGGDDYEYAFIWGKHHWGDERAIFIG